MTANPIDIVIVDGVNVSKSDLRSYEKLRVRMRVADANEVRATNFTGQYGGLRVAALTTDFDLDTADTTTGDDGTSCIIDFAGNRFKRVNPLITRVSRTVTASGAVTILSTDEIVIIKKTVGAATTVNVDWSAQTRPLTIVDGKGDANTNNITIVPASGQTQYAITNYQVVIDGNGGSVTLTPLPDGSGAY